MSDDRRSLPGLTLEQFTRRVRIIEGHDADLLRDSYSGRFVDTSSVYFRDLIANPGPQGDEVCYTGYLWDTLNHPEAMTESQVLAALARWTEVYIFWDLHNAKKIWIQNYWKFPLQAVLRGRSVDLIDALRHDAEVDEYEAMILPEDIYIFTDTMDTSLILTHEETEDRERCV